MSGVSLRIAAEPRDPLLIGQVSRVVKPDGGFALKLACSLPVPASCCSGKGGARPVARRNRSRRGGDDEGERQPAPRRFRTGASREPERSSCLLAALARTRPSASRPANTSLLAKTAGLLCDQGGNLVKAASNYEEALATEGPEPFTLVALADVYCRLGRRTEAQACLGRAEALAQSIDDDDGLRLVAAARSRLMAGKGLTCASPALAGRSRGVRLREPAEVRAAKPPDATRSRRFRSFSSGFTGAARLSAVPDPVQPSSGGAGQAPPDGRWRRQRVEPHGCVAAAGALTPSPSDRTRLQATGLRNTRKFGSNDGSRRNRSSPTWTSSPWTNAGGGGKRSGPS